LVEPPSIGLAFGVEKRKGKRKKKRDPLPPDDGGDLPEAGDCWTEECISEYERGLIVEYKCCWVNGVDGLFKRCHFPRECTQTA
jgi:hypothetical protein